MLVVLKVKLEPLLRVADTKPVVLMDPLLPKLIAPFGAFSTTASVLFNEHTEQLTKASIVMLRSAVSVNVAAELAVPLAIAELTVMSPLPPLPLLVVIVTLVPAFSELTIEDALTIELALVGL